MDEVEGEAIFKVLRPLCVEVISVPSVKSLFSLQTGLMELPQGAVIPPQLVAYLTLPVRAAIKRAGSSNGRLLESALIAMAELLSRVRDMNMWDIFHDMFSFLCVLLDEKMAAEAGFVSPSEELLTSCLRTLKELMLCINLSIHEQLLSNLVAMGHCISTLLVHCTSTSSSHDVRRYALTSLCALTGLDTAPILAYSRLTQTTPDLSQAVDAYLSLVRERVGAEGCGRGRALASFLPGVSTAVTKLLTSDAKTVESVVSLGLITWAHYVVLVVGGEEWKELGLLQDEQAVKQESLAVCRTGVWLEETAKRLGLLIQCMCVLVTNEVWKVRVHLVGWAHSLLQHCSISLEVCVPYLLEVLVTLSHDPYPQVSTAAHASLKQFPGGGCGLSSLLGQQLHSLVSSLPRLIRQHDDNRKVATLQLLAGYLHLTGSHVSLMLHSLPHLSRLVQALVQTLTLQTDSPHVLSLSLPTLNPSSLSTKPLPLLHTHFSSDTVAALLREVCLLLGCHGDFLVLVDYVMDQCHAHPQLRCEYLLLLSQVLRGGGHKGCGHQEPPPTHVSQDELFTVIEGVVTRLVSPDFWTLSHDPSSTTDHSSMNSDLYAFLLINTIFTCVHVVMEKFAPLLQQLMYPLMQKLGDEKMGVSDAAMATLQAICLHCHYESVSHLIAANTDYLVHSISVHLRLASYRGWGHAEAIQVLCAVMSHGDEGVCPMIKGCVNELLLSLDTKQLAPALVWTGLCTLSKSCEHWISKRGVKEQPVGVAEGVEPGGKKEEVKDGSSEGKVGLQAIADYFLKYHKEKEQEGEGGGAEVEEEGGGAEVEEEGGGAEVEGERGGAEVEEEGGGAEVEGERGGAEVEEEGGRAEVVEEEEGEDYSQERPLPAVEQVSVELMRRCGHHMSHDNPSIRLVVMETLQHCMKTLKDEKLTLYPEVHVVWAPLLPRLTDSSPPVSRRAWQVIQCMCEVCGDFVRKRVLEKVWPLLISTLEQLAPTSANSDSLYNQSAKFKLQCVLLESVGILCTTLSVPPHQLESVAAAALPYLSQDQPPKLQDTCSECFTRLIVVDPHMMWLLLQQMVPPTVTMPTHPSLKPFTFPINPDSAKYAKNVEPLLLLTFKV